LIHQSFIVSIKYNCYCSRQKVFLQLNCWVRSGTTWWEWSAGCRSRVPLSRIISSWTHIRLFHQHFEFLQWLHHPFHISQIGFSFMFISMMLVVS
jgi:hypothetical protein